MQAHRPRRPGASMSASRSGPRSRSWSPIRGPNAASAPEPVVPESSGVQKCCGAAVHWYPYPFLNPTHPGGYGRVVLYAVVLALFMGLLALAVNALGRIRTTA